MFQRGQSKFVRFCSTLMFNSFYFVNDHHLCPLCCLSVLHLQTFCLKFVQSVAVSYHSVWFVLTLFTCNRSLVCENTLPKVYPPCIQWQTHYIPLFPRDVSIYFPGWLGTFTCINPCMSGAESISLKISFSCGHFWRILCLAVKLI